MLPAAHRLRDAGEYRAVLRDRRAGRAGGSLLVVHVIDTDAIGLDSSGRHGPRVGFVVSKAVGNAVVRSRVKRQLRHLMRDRLDVVPERYDVVVRAHPLIAGCTSAEIERELTRMLDKAQTRSEQNAARVSRETSGS